MPIEPEQQLLHYRLIGKIGEGGMGVVWKALDTTLDREVAIKVLPEAFTADTERLNRFEREAKLLASLNHPNIASIYGLHEVPATESAAPLRFLAMELIAGEDLSERLERGPLPVTEAINVALQIAAALEAAHDNGIIHRDLKPANVRFTAPAGGSSPAGIGSTARSVKVLDFGLAKALDGGEANQKLTQSPTITGLATQAGVILGTASYMSPEQARGQAADRRADIFSFGVVLYEMLTGKRLFGGATVSDTLADILRAEADLGALPDGTPAQVRRLLVRCLAKDPARRLQAVGDARIELREALDAPELAVAAAPVEATRSSRPGPIRLAAAAVLAVALVATGWLLRQPEPPQVAVLRAAVTLPAGTLLDGDNRSISLSPDGSVLAYAARDDQGTSGIWIRRMDSTASQLLSGTEGATYPFWSPDGRQLGFFADGRLRKIPAAGGTAVTLCEAAEGRGASWSSAGVIVFSPGPFGPLFKVAASGGTPTAVTTEEREGYTHRNPHFLPDGKRLLFYLGSSSSDQEDDGIYSLDLESGETSRVAAVRSEGLYVEPGYLAFVRDGNLVVQPMDLETLELSGEPVPLVEQVQFNAFRFTGTFTFARNGLLLHRGGTAQVESRLTWFDFDGNELGRVGEPARFWISLDIAPDGKRAVTVIRHADGGGSDLWMYDLERGLGSRFTFGEDAAIVPRWSPDGSQIAYSNVSGATKVKAADGTTPARAVHDVASGGFVSDWSPDGKQFLLWNQDSANGGELGLVSIDGGGERVPLVSTPANETWGKFSPDGKWLTSFSDASGRQELYLFSYPEVSGKWQISDSGAVSYAWLPDSSGVVYVTPAQSLVRVRIIVTASGPSFGAAEELFGGRFVDLGANSWAIAPDGKRLLVTVPLENETAPTLELVSNWVEELK